MLGSESRLQRKRLRYVTLTKEVDSAISDHAWTTDQFSTHPVVIRPLSHSRFLVLLTGD
jgi:hypothetical protein